MTDRLFVALAALFGFWGVAAAAAAAHIGGTGTLGTAANFMLFHAGVLVGLPAVAKTAIVHPRVARLGGWLIVAGVGLFASDLALRALIGSALFPMAAPIGGSILMLGWASIGTAALIRSRL